MKRLLVPIVLFAPLHFVGCASEPMPLSDGERSEIEQRVRERVDAFVEAERRRDADAILDFIADDFYMYADGNRVDFPTVVEQIRSTMPSLQAFETTWSDIEVTVLGRDHALVSLKFRDVLTDGEGVTMRLRGPTTFVWRLHDDEWRLIYADADHYPDTQ